MLIWWQCIFKKWKKSLNKSLYHSRNYAKQERYCNLVFVSALFNFILCQYFKQIWNTLFNITHIAKWTYVLVFIVLIYCRILVKLFTDGNFGARREQSCISACEIYIWLKNNMFSAGLLVFQFYDKVSHESQCSREKLLWFRSTTVNFYFMSLFIYGWPFVTWYSTFMLRTIVYN